MQTTKEQTCMDGQSDEHLNVYSADGIILFLPITKIAMF